MIEHRNTGPHINVLMRTKCRKSYSNRGQHDGAAGSISILQLLVRHLSLGYCVRSFTCAPLSVWDSSRFSSFLPSPSNMHKIHFPWVWMSVGMNTWCLWGPWIPSGVCSCLMPSVPWMGSGSTVSLIRIITVTKRQGVPPNIYGFKKELSTWG